MGREENEVYHNLTESVDAKNAKGSINQKWTLYLMLACITVCASSFSFGFNIGSTNLPTPLIKDFFAQRYFSDHKNNTDEYTQKLSNYVAKKSVFDESNNSTNTSALDAIKSELTDQTIEENLSATKLELDELKANLDKVEKVNTLLWTLANTLFVVGGMVGAITSKYVAEYFGRKKGILFHYIFILLGGVLVVIAPYVNSPECVIISRFLYGIQGGMCCGLIPTYLSEVSPVALRGATGVLHQLCVTVGILIAQLLGFRQLMGVPTLWHFLLGIPIVPAVLGGVVLMVFFSETPRALLTTNKDEDAAREVLERLRNTSNVQYEIDQMNQEQRETKSDEAVSVIELFTLKELRWPLITSLVIQISQQFCGINAVFFYSEKIFNAAGIQAQNIQYAVALTGIVNVIMTIVCVPLIDRLGRKPLLVYPMALIVVNFILMTIFLVFQKDYWYFSYLSVACVMIFICCFAIGLGPIPFIYVAECFRQDARSTALAVCMLVNWFANTLLTLTFPYLADLLTNYVFIVFAVIVGAAVLVIFKKVPETKGRTVDEIMDKMNGARLNRKYDESDGKLMSTNNV